MSRSSVIQSKPRILIVDDSLTVRMDLGEAFESAGFDVTMTESLLAARNALAQQVFALALLDVLLPDGDGIDLLREIKAGSATAGLPVMLLSTEAEVRDRARGLKTGADDYVGKPYDTSYVLARAQQLLKVGATVPPLPRILLIDDSATFRNSFKTVLETAGFAVITAESGEEGLRTAFSTRPNLILVDQVLGEGIDGNTVTRRLKQDVTLRETPCLLLTASSDPSDELHALEAGADAYLRKDTDEGVILARVTGLVRSLNRARTPAMPASSLLAAKRILAVDDSPTYLNELAAQLRQEGYGVVPVSSGREALEILQLQPADCILLDVRMPELSGTETCRLIKQQQAFRSIPLLMLTAAEEPDAVIEGINAGADDYVPKSADFSVLKARMRAQLRRKQFEDEHRRIQEELLQSDLDTARAKHAQSIAEARAALVDELERKNLELEAFTYSVSHDLRAPLRAIRGFSQALLEDFGEQLPPDALDLLQHVQAASMRMSQLIEALLEMSRTSRASLNREPVDVSELARAIALELTESDVNRQCRFIVAEKLTALADPALLRAVLNNLLGNAWKFTGKTPLATIEVGAANIEGEPCYFVRDNGAGFDAARAKRLFQPFERLHAATEFPGAGIGLATVRRIVERHGGRAWAESMPGEGATFFFTLGPPPGTAIGSASSDMSQKPPAFSESGFEPVAR